MATFHRFFGFWIASFLILFTLSCSQSSSQLAHQSDNTAAEITSEARSAFSNSSIQAPTRPSDEISIKVNRLQYSDANLLVRLNGEINSESGVPLREVRWTQIGEQTATILNPRQPETLVLLPDVPEPTELTFRLLVVNNQDLANAATTTVLAQPPADAADARVISAVVNEEASAIDFTIALNKPANVPLSVTYKTIDRTAVSPQDYLPATGTLTFEVGETQKVVSVEIVDDDEADSGEYFELGINGVIPNGEGEGGEPFGSVGVGVIQDNEPTPSYPTGPPVIVDDTETPQQNLEGESGIIRINLDWLEAAENVDLIIQDPCGQILDIGVQSVDCLGGVGVLEVFEGPVKNAYWSEYATPGNYIVSIQHQSGDSVSYQMEVYYGEESAHITGAIGNGDYLQVYSFDYDGGDSTSSATSSSDSSESSSSIESSDSTESSSSQASSSSDSASSDSASSDSSSSDSASSSDSSSSEESSSSESESSSSEASSSSEESSSSDSSEASSSVDSSSSSSSSSSSESSSSEPPALPTVTLDLGEQSEFVTSVVSVSGSTSAVPAAPIVELNVHLSRAGEAVGTIPLSLNELNDSGGFTLDLDLSQGDWELIDGGYDLQISVRDSIGRAAQSNIRPITLRTPQALAIVIESPQQQTYFDGVEIAGAIIADSALDVTASVDLAWFVGEGSNRVEIVVEEDLTFSFSVNEPGAYELSVVASDGIDDVSESVQFDVIPSTVSALLSTSAAELENGDYDVIDALPLEAIVQSNFEFSPNSAELVFSDDGQVALRETLALGEIWDSERGVLTTSVDLSSLDLGFGYNEVYILFSYGEGQQVSTNRLPVQYRPAEPLQLQLEALGGEQFFQPVSLLGSASADVLRTLTLTATLDNVEDELPAQPVTLVREGDGFSYSVDVPGNYLFEVTATDGVEQLAQQARFVYTAPAVTVSLTHQHPLNEAGALDIVGPLSLQATIVTESPQLLNGLSLVVTNSEVPFTLVELDLSNTQDQSSQWDLLYNFISQEADEGTYTVQAVVAYGDGGVSNSAPLRLDFRQPLALSVALDPIPSLNFNAVDISGSYTVDPTRSLRLVGLLADGFGEGPAQPVELSIENGRFTYTVDQPGNFNFSVTAEDGVSEPVSDSAQFTYQIAQASCELNHDYPLSAAQQVETLGVFEYTAVITTNNLAALNNVELQIQLNNQWQTLDSFPVGDNFSTPTTEIPGAVDFVAGEFAPDSYALRLLLEYGAGQTTTCAADSVNFRDRQPIQLAIDEIFNGQTFYNPVDVTGTVSVDPLLASELSLTASLLQPESSVIATDIAVDGSTFTVPVGQPGQYLLQVTATDGVESVTDEIELSYWIPDVQLSVDHTHPTDEGNVLDLIGDLALQVGVVEANNLNITISQFAIEAAFVDGLVEPQAWDQVVTFPFAEVWDGEVALAGLTFPLNAQSGFGLRAFRVRADVDGYQPVYSDVLFGNFREIQPLIIDLQSPSNNASYFASVPVAGTVSWEPQGTLQISAVLDNLNDEAPGQALPLQINGGAFSAAVDQPGNYQLIVSAEDGYNAATAAAQFIYVDAAVSLSVEPLHPVNDGLYVVTDSLSALVTLTGDDALPKTSFELQRSLGDGAWASVQTYDFASVWNETAQNAQLNFDFNSQDLGFAEYPLRVRLNYADGLSEDSLPFNVNYRPYQNAALSILEPSQESTHYTSYPIIVSVDADPLANISVTGTFPAGEGEATTVDFIPQQDGTYLYDVTQPGRYDMIIAVDDTNSEASPDDAQALFSEFVAPVVSVEVSHDHVLLENGAIDLYEPLNIQVLATSNTTLPPQTFRLLAVSEAQTQVLQTYDATQVWDPSSGVANLVYDFAEEGFGEYTLRVEAELSGAVATGTSDDFSVAYRAYIPAQLSLVEPAQQATLYQPYSIVVAVDGDPRGNFSVTGRYPIDDGSFETVQFSDQGDGTYGFSVTQDGSYDMQIAVDDSNTTVAPDDEIQALSAYIDPVVNIGVDHTHPVLESGDIDLYEPLSLDVTVSSNTNLAPTEFRLMMIEGEGDVSELSAYSAEEVWDPQASVARLVFDFEDLPFGTYNLFVEVILGGNPLVSGQSGIFGVNWRSLDALVIDISSPANNAVLPAPVQIQGAVSGDPALDIDVQATLLDLDSEAAPTPVELNRDGNEFFYLVENQGRYRFSVIADNGVQTATAQVDFAYQITELSVDVAHSHPVLESGNLDIIGPVALRASTDNPQQYPLQQYALEVLGGDGWIEQQSVPVQAGQTEYTLGFDFSSLEAAFGVYPVRVRLDYLDGLNAYSDVFQLEYRAFQQPRFTAIDSPLQGVNFGQALLISGGYEVDPSADAEGVWATLSINGDPLTERMLVPALGGRFEGQVGGDALLQANTLTLEVTDTLGNTSGPVDIPIQFVFIDELFVEIVEPGLSTVSVFEPELDLTADFYPVAGSVDLSVRLLNVAGQELLVDDVEGSEAWSIVGGSFSGTFDFGQLTLENDNYLVEVVASYSNGTVVRDSLTLAYAEPDVPVVIIEEPAVRDFPYSFEVDVTGRVQIGEPLGVDDITRVYGRLERLGPNPEVLDGDFPLSFDSGRFSGTLTPNFINQTARYQLTVLADDSLGRTSNPASVIFSYETPTQLGVQINSPVVEPGNQFVELFAAGISISGQVQFQQGYPVEDLTVSAFTDGVQVGQPVNVTNALNDNGSFTANLILDQLGIGEGEYEFRVAATDVENRTARASLPVWYRLAQLPSIELRRAESNDPSLIGGAFTAVFDYDSRLEENVVITAEVRNPAGNIQAIRLPNPNLNGESGNVSFNVPNSQVFEGQNTVWVTINDGRNQASASSDPFIFSAPIVNIVVPREVEGGIQATGDTLTLEFSVDFSGQDLNADTLPNFTLFHSGQVIPNAVAQNNQQGLWRVVVDISNFAEGPHGLGIVVGDYRRPEVVNDRFDTSMRSRLDFTIPPRIQAPVVNIDNPGEDNQSFYNSLGEQTDYFSFTAQVDYFGTNEAPSGDDLDYGLQVNGQNINAFVSQIFDDAGNSTNRYQFILVSGGVIEGVNSISLTVADFRDSNLVSSPARRTINIIKPNVDVRVEAGSGNGSQNNPYTGSITLVLVSNGPINQMDLSINGEIYDIPNLTPDNTPPYEYRIPIPTSRLESGSNSFFMNGIVAGLPFPFDSREFGFFYEGLQDASVLVLSPLPNSNVNGDLQVGGRINTWDDAGGVPVINVQILQNGTPLGSVVTQTVTDNETFDFDVPFESFNGFGDYVVRIWAQSDSNPDYQSPVNNLNISLQRPTIFISSPANQTYTHIVPLEGSLQNFDQLLRPANLYYQVYNGSTPVGSASSILIPANGQFSVELNRSRFPSAGAVRLAVWAQSRNTPEYETARTFRNFTLAPMDELRIVIDSPTDAQLPWVLDSENDRATIRGRYWFDERYPVRLLLHRELRNGTFSSSYNGTPLLNEDGTYSIPLIMNNLGQNTSPSGTYDVWVELKEDVEGNVGRSAVSRQFQVNYTRLE